MTDADSEARHRACWYGRRTSALPLDVGCHTIADGELLYCAHPMWFPVVGYQFDVRNCVECDYFKGSAAHPTDRATRTATS